jgi:hypothetical protein
MNSGKIGLNFCMNQMFCKFGLSAAPRVIIVKQSIQKENTDEQSRRNSKENQGLGA